MTSAFVVLSYVRILIATEKIKNFVLSPRYRRQVRYLIGIYAPQCHNLFLVLTRVYGPGGKDVFWIHQLLFPGKSFCIIGRKGDELTYFSYSPQHHLLWFSFVLLYSSYRAAHWHHSFDSGHKSCDLWPSYIYIFPRYRRPCTHHSRARRSLFNQRQPPQQSQSVVRNPTTKKVSITQQEPISGLLTQL